MELNGLKIRWINYCCYEMILPNGKEIIIDPCIDVTNQEERFHPDDFQGADYILLSHTHGDHILDLKYISDKFKPHIFVGALSAYPLAKDLDLNLDEIFPVSPGEKYELPDFTLEVFRGKHTWLNRPDNRVKTWLKGDSKDFPKEISEANALGSIEYMDYLITTNENLRIFITGGGPYEKFYFNAFETAKNKAPDIVIRQATSKYGIKEFADMAAEYHCQFLIPEHHDKFVKKMGMTPQQWAQALNEQLRASGSMTQVYAPEQFKWFEVYTGIRDC